jgi:hypothetical protein
MAILDWTTMLGIKKDTPEAELGINSKVEGNGLCGEKDGYLEE